MEKKIIAILGMHRSGTSLISSWLQECGLNIGSRLLSDNIGNANGHFEDLDFLAFHEGLFLKNSLNHINAKAEDIEIDDFDIAMAKNIIKLKLGENPVFAWKDPRTCIFLNNLWEKTEYDICYLFVYRPFDHIINSLYNRHIKMLNNSFKYQLTSNNLIIKIKNQIYIKINKKKILEDYCIMYSNYMEEILKFHKNLRLKKRFLAIEINSTIKNSKKVLNTINNNWYTSLKSIDLGIIFNPNQFTNDNINLESVNINLIKKCRILDQELRDLTFNKSVNE